MNLKNLVETLIVDHGADAQISTNNGPMTLREFTQTVPYVDGRFSNLSVGLDEDGNARVKLEKGVSGPVFRLLPK